MNTPAAVVNVGADLLADAIADQAVPVTRVDWRPPMEGTEADLATVAADPRRPEANARALAAVLGVTATLVDVAPASELLGLERGQFLHAGPPIAWDRAPARSAARSWVVPRSRGWSTTRRTRWRCSSPAPRCRWSPATTGQRSVRWPAS